MLRQIPKTKYQTDDKIITFFDIQANNNGRPSRSDVSRGGGGGGDDIPGYLLAQRGQGMFSHQQQSEADQYDSAINQQQKVST